MITNTRWYSSILAILMVGFMLILTMGVFNIMMKEFKDTRVIQKGLKAYYAAESGLELALLDVKQYGMSFNDETPLGSSELKANILKQSVNKDSDLGYEVLSRTNNIQVNLEANGYYIVPLFYTDDSLIEQKVTNLNLIGGNTNIKWNIVSTNAGITGVGDFTSSTLGNKKTLIWGNFSFNTESIQDFLQTNDTNYLILFNNGADANFNVTSSQYFTDSSGIDILSQGKNLDTKQNLELRISFQDNLNFLKYSIFNH